MQSAAGIFVDSEMLNKTSDRAIIEIKVECDLIIDVIETPMPKYSIQSPIPDSQYGFGFVYPNLWQERLQEIMEGLVTGGFINMLFDRYTKSKWNVISNELGMDRTLIDLSHLAFVFQICLIVYYGAFLVFIGELIVKRIMIKVKRMMLEYQPEIMACRNILSKIFDPICNKLPKSWKSTSTSSTFKMSINNSSLNSMEISNIENVNDEHRNNQISVEVIDDLDSD